MSKVDAQRALRDARFAAYRARVAAQATRRPAEAVARSVNEPVIEAAIEPVNEAVAAPALCGHRNMGNKTCRRPAGHPEKSHRYV